MIVYVETNYVIEMALEQEQFCAARQILQLARDGKIVLTFPSFALVEPFWTLANWEAKRNRLNEQLQSLNVEIKQLQRSGLHSALLEVNFAKIAKKERHSLQNVVKDLLSFGRPIQLGGPEFEQALRMQTTLGLEIMDAIIYSTLVSDLRRQDVSLPKCFISRDKEAFKARKIREDLRTFGCTYIPDFNNGLKFIESALARVPNS